MHGLHSDWLALAWPQARESFFAGGIEQLVGYDRSAGEAGSCRPLLEPLLDPDVPLGPMARLVLGGALAANQPELRGLAVDALIAAVDDGRLDSEALGGSIRALLAGRLIPPSRLARSLGEAARIAPLHAGAVARVVQGFMAAETIATRDLAGLLELLHEALIATGGAVTAPGAADFLGQVGGSGKAATLARRIVSLSADPHCPARIEAATRALAGRVERAERWQRSERSDARGTDVRPNQPGR